MEILKAILTAYTVACVIFTTIFLINLFRHLRQEIKQINSVKTAKETIKLIYIERHQGYSYAYDRFTNNFIAHAESDELVLVKAKELFPNHQIGVQDRTQQAQ